MMVLREYLFADRQWKREHRLKHARYMLSLATKPYEKQFWQDVISMNEDEENNG